MEYENILLGVEDGIATITFNRPKALNALNAPLVRDLSDAIKKVSEDEEIRCLILTGSGDKAFVAGADIVELTKFNSLQAKNHIHFVQSTFDNLQKLSVPVIAAVNGFALGGGLEVAMSCDFIYASDNAKFGLPEINLGLIPGFGGTQRLPRMIGPNLAKEMLFTGKMIDAQEANSIGLVNRVMPQSELMDAVMKTAKTIASKGKVSLRAAKQTVNSGLNVDLETGCKMEADIFSICISSEDAKEGTTAFLEKRKAEFKGTYNS